MPEFPDTRNSLIARMQSPDDEEAWTAFTSIYRPVVYRLARKRGLQDADSDDLAQQVMIAVRRAIGNWNVDPSRGRFHYRLATIARNAAINVVARRQRDAAAGGTAVQELLEKHPESEFLTQNNLEREYRRSVFRRAAERIRPEFSEATWDAFWLTTVEGLRTEEAGLRLGKSLGAIYALRSRVMRRLREEIGPLNADGET
jgi:RNA polymerase sigma-70 factor, ECF subfamily